MQNTGKKQGKRIVSPQFCLCLLIFSLMLTSCTAVRYPSADTGTAENETTGGETGEISAAESAVPEDTVTQIETDGIRNTGVFLDVPFISQVEKYPTGCEAVSAVMALQNAGVPISVDEFIAECLPIAPYHYWKDGGFYGADPQQYFSGDPYTTEAFGCYSGAIVRAFERLKQNHPEWADRFTYTVLSCDSVSACEPYLTDPILIWGSTEMREPNETHRFFVLEYDETDGMKETVTDRMLPWLEPQHCLVLVGYDAENYYFNDPQRGKTVPYPKDACEVSFAAYGCQAIAVSGTQTETE